MVDARHGRLQQAIRLCKSRASSARPMLQGESIGISRQNIQNNKSIESRGSQQSIYYNTNANEAALLLFMNKLMQFLEQQRAMLSMCFQSLMTAMAPSGHRTRSEAVVRWANAGLHPALENGLSRSAPPRF
jgi:hypothetical protein